MPLDAPPGLASLACPDAACKNRISAKDHKGPKCYKCGKAFPEGFLNICPSEQQATAPGEVAAPGSPATRPWRKAAISADQAKLEELYKLAGDSEKLFLPVQQSTRKQIERIEARINVAHEVAPCGITDIYGEEKRAELPLRSSKKKP